MIILKRDGREVKFDPTKITNVVIRAMAETEVGIDEELAKEITDNVAATLFTSESEEGAYIEWTVDEINNLVEEELMDSDRKDVARAFIKYRDKRDEKRKRPWVMEELAQAIWEKKYRFKNETISEFFDRVCEGDYDLRKLMADKLVVPAGRVLSNRGLHKLAKKVTLSNCYVTIPPEDNIESIFDTAKRLARTFSFGGGIGVDISNLRPNGAAVNNAAEESSGAVSFMELFSKTTEIISQRGRRGALMISIDGLHPDIEEFIDVKNDLTKVTKANISVRASDELMEAVVEGKFIDLKFEGRVYKTIEAKSLIRKLAANNHKMAEPGILFWSRVENWCLLSNDDKFKFAGVNP